jgi:hypothetical protein
LNQSRLKVELLDVHNTISFAFVIERFAHWPITSPLPIYQANGTAMTIDPVILLVEELRSVELALSKATQTYRRTSQREDGEVINLLLAKLKRLFGELFETMPTSSSGAAELIDIAAQRLPFAYARFAAHLHNVADRLSQGRRDHPDLVWLRAMQAALLEGVCGDEGRKMAPLLDLAIRGAARPVMIFRTTLNVPGPAPWKNVLAAHPV